uniref:Uncharacterized protein n=2 Tax=Nicotiana TaxID=4085 RepID=A0A1S3ZWQ2_TOBAC|nr:PREDICTED: uncharacterized protein LOC104210713 [Nicotiana sylvestris]XP_016468875.1 PREDICTED: uncharacterized protein LOC107791346 [Nicotiana tabacum]
MSCETTKGEITLMVNTTETIQETKFYMIDGDMRYNALFGRPWIHNMRALPTTLHRAFKFPMPRGIKPVYGEQPAAKEMFLIDEVIIISALSTSQGSSSVAKGETK